LGGAIANEPMLDSRVAGVGRYKENAEAPTRARNSRGRCETVIAMASNPLDPLPRDFARSRAGLHRLAEGVIKLTREHVTGEFSLIATPGGFGTPVFGPHDAQVRVEAGDLVVKVGEDERRAPITSLRAATQLAADLLPDDLDLDDEPLGVDPEASHALGRWYALGEELLQRLRAEARAEHKPTEPILWPEHFDIAIVIGEANYGFSPGDEAHAEPYAYVGPFGPVEGELWNATGFAGAELTYAELLAGPDPRAAALEFFTTRKEALA
jgi:hypothetical protein